MKRRASGILLHITSLPSAFGIGDLGPEAYRFADFLEACGQTLWQILPLNPTDMAFGNSPYHSISAFASNPWILSPEGLVKEGYLSGADLHPLPASPRDRVDYAMVVGHRQNLFKIIQNGFGGSQASVDLERFCLENAGWLDDYALFVALKAHLGKAVWREWPEPLRDRDPRSLEEARTLLRERIEQEKLLQFLFSIQWRALREYCNNKGILIFGDLPIYVNYDSADVWAHPHLFKLDHEKRPYVVAGVPPDYFSETGQLWGNPLYDWDVMRREGFSWWIRRIKRAFDLYDMVRIDHFRGLVGCWEVPADHETAINGRWVEVPAEEFFLAILKRFPYAPLVAEDLGVITPDVREIMYRFGFPGMKLLIFAFGDNLAKNPYVPHNLPVNALVYTGTHDNNTVKGWFEREAGPEDKRRLFSYLGREIPTDQIHWEMIRLAMMSVANIAIFPVQDLLGLGEEARMNRPSISGGNWAWRLSPDALTPALAKRVREMTEIYGRA
jgi:4-alpha-glucanotransferase